MKSFLVKSAAAYYPLLFVLLVISASFYPLPIGRFYAIGDIRDVYIPIEQFFHTQVVQGHLPAWLADAAWGFPVIASAQIGFFYPPLLALRQLPLSVYLPILLLAHFLWIGLGTFLFYRRFCAPSSAAVGALSFSLGGYIVLHLTHLNIIFSLAWLPWQFLLIYSLASRPLTHRTILYLGLLLAIPFLVGQIQIPLLMFFISSVWFLYLRHRFSFSLIRSFVILVIVASLVVLISSVQLLPTYELMTQSTRDISSAAFDITRANQHSFPVYHLPTLLFPRFFANDDMYWGRRLQIEYGVYMGTFPLIAALLFLFRPRSIDQPSLPTNLFRVTPFFLFLLIISFLMALGSLSPFRLLKIEPSLWFFSAPARWLLFTSFAFSFFAAAGADRYFKQPAYYRQLFRRLFLILLSFLIVCQLILWVLVNYSSVWLNSYLSSAHQQKISSLIFSASQSSISLASLYTWLPLLMIFAFSCRFILRHPVRWALSLTAIELFLLFITTTPTLPWAEIIPPPSTLSNLPSSVLTGQSRLYSIREGGDTGAYFTNPNSRANAILRQQQRQLFVPLINTQFNLSGIEWPASLDLGAHSAIFSKLRTDDSYELTNAPLAKQLNIGAVLKSSDQSVSVRPADYAPRLELISPDSISTPLSYPHNPNGSFTVNLDVSQQSTLVVRDSFYPGWRATIDSRPTAISVYQDIFRQITVPAGRHQVTFSYYPAYLYAGLVITSLTLSLIMIWLISTIFYHRFYR